MKHKKFLSLLLAFAMLMSVSISAFASDPGTDPGTDPTGNNSNEENTPPVESYFYTSTSDPLEIVNRSNVATNVTVEVQFSGLDGVNFVDKKAAGVSFANGNFTQSGETVQKALYLALLVDKTEGVSSQADDANATDPDATDPDATAPNATDPNANSPAATVTPIPFDASGYATTAKSNDPQGPTKLEAAAVGAYKWSVSNNVYTYALRAELQPKDAPTKEFSKLSIKMTGAVGKAGWGNMGAISPQYTLTWKCDAVDPEEEAEPARVHYVWKYGSGENDQMNVYWDKTDKVFYTTESKDTNIVVTGLLTPNQTTEIEDDGSPSPTYLNSNHLTLYVADAGSPERVEYVWTYTPANSAPASKTVFWDKTEHKFYAAKTGGEALTDTNAPTVGSTSYDATSGALTSEFITTNKLSTPVVNVARVSYTWKPDENTAKLIYWDISTQKFYTAKTGNDATITAGTHNFTQPNASATPSEIGADGCPTLAYLNANKVLPKDVYSNGSSTNNVRFEGDGPASIIDILVPTAADNPFDFILDPNDLIKETAGANYSKDEFDFEDGTYTGVFFKCKSGGENTGNGDANYTGPTATITEAAVGASTTEYMKIKMDFGQSGMTKVKSFTYLKSGGTSPLTVVASPTSTTANGQWHADDNECWIKTIANIVDGSEWTLVLVNDDGSETMNLPLTDIFSTGSYTVPAAGG